MTRGPRVAMLGAATLILAVWLIPEVAMAATPAPAPSLRLSPTAGPVGSTAYVSGRAPTSAPCPSVQVTVAPPSGGAAAVVESFPVHNGRYSGRFRVPAVPVPTTPATVSKQLVVRVSCTGSAGRNRFATRWFTVTFPIGATRTTAGTPPTSIGPVPAGGVQAGGGGLARQQREQKEAVVALLAGALMAGAGLLLRRRGRTSS